MYIYTLFKQCNSKDKWIEATHSQAPMAPCENRTNNQMLIPLVNHYTTLRKSRGNPILKDDIT